MLVKFLTLSDALMRLERRVRSDLIETFKITNGMYDVNKEVFILNWMTVVEGDMSKNCLKRDLDWI